MSLKQVMQHWLQTGDVAVSLKKATVCELKQSTPDNIVITAFNFHFNLCLAACRQRSHTVQICPTKKWYLRNCYLY